MTPADHGFMARALQLARRGCYSTSPNPRVGCVLVREGKVLAEGWHIRSGEAHAEVNALRAAGDARGATAYVTLEPCSHHGRTPPCCEALVAAGVQRVVVAMQDPNPQVAGQGVASLQAAGITVDVGLLEKEAQQLNAGFLRRVGGGLPWVALKLAMSVDGRTAMASGESQWITGPEARADVQRLRARSCAIVSGVETILRDDAALTVRPDMFASAGEREAGEPWRQPLRVILDSQLRTPPQSRLLESGGSVVIAAVADHPQRRRQLEQRGAEVRVVPAADGRIALRPLLELLAQRQCNEVLVEAGASLAGAFVEAGLVDVMHIYMAPTLLGSEGRPLLQLPLQRMAEQRRLHILGIRAVGDDWRIDAQPQ